MIRSDFATYRITHVQLPGQPCRRAVYFMVDGRVTGLPIMFLRDNGMELAGEQLVGLANLAVVIGDVVSSGLTDEQVGASLRRAQAADSLEGSIRILGDAKAAGTDSIQAFGPIL